MDISANPFFSPDTVILKAEEAVLEGRQIRLEEQTGRTNIGYWDNRNEGVHWLLAIPDAGEYRFRGEFAAVDTSQLSLQVDGKETVFSIPRTGNWSASTIVEMGSIRFDKPGVYHLQIRASQTDHRAVNLWQVICEKQ